MIRKFHEAKQEERPHVEVWGTGTPRREFLYVDDLANAALFIMEHYDYRDVGELVNVGAGEDLTIREIANMVRRIVGYRGEIRWDHSKPDGMPGNSSI